MTQTPVAAPELPKGPALATIVKDQVFVLGVVVVFVGIVTSEAYYAAFGVSYQFLSLPASHIVYRGFTALIGSPWVVLPYLAVVTWLWLDGVASRRGWTAFLVSRELVSYLLFLLILLGTYPLARNAGLSAASADMVEASSRLPKIVMLRLKDGTEITPDDRHRLLIVDSTFVIVIQPAPSAGHGTVPNVKRIRKDDVATLETIA